MILEHLDEYTARAVSSGGRRAATWWLDVPISAYRIRFEWSAAALWEAATEIDKMAKGQREAMREASDD